MVSNQPVNPHQTVVPKMPCFLYKVAVAQDEEAYTMQVFPHLAIVAIQRLHYGERHMTVLQYLTQAWRLHSPDSVKVSVKA